MMSQLPVPDVAPLIQALNYFHPVSAGIEQYFKDHTRSRTVSKKKLILKANTVCATLTAAITAAAVAKAKKWVLL